MRASSSRIATQVALISCGILAVAIVAFCLLAYFRTEAILDERNSTDLNARVALMGRQLETFDATIKGNADRLASIFQNTIGSVRVDGGRTVTVGGREVPTVLGSGSPLNLDFSAVDGFSRATQGVATVFVRTGDDFMRVTTSLRKEDGSRAMGTLLGAAHPAHKAMLAGEPYLGKAHLFGRDYMTKYTPVRDGSGQVVAILFIGLDITDNMATLEQQIASSKVGEKGFFFALDAADGKTRGVLVAHPHAQGKSVVDASGDLAPFKTILDQRSGYLEAGGKAYVFAPYQHWGWIVGAEVDLKELHADAANLRNLMLLIGVLVLAAGCVVTYLTLSRRLAPVRVLADVVERLGAGDLTVRSRHAGADEIGELSTAFNRMADQFSAMVQRLQAAAAGVREAVAQVRDESAQVRKG
ncbi:MAG: Cache 3/Cache 2 fusion domain-containing protein, partial [Burkholderiales bacterium]|nr:Cache 3/Cache 2 fusion domain-containing protein [Burkholderiales bacterium]